MAGVDAPEVPAVAALSPTSARLTFATPAPTSFGGASFTGYTVRWRDTDGGGGWSNVVEVAADTATHEIGVLPPGSAVRVEVRARASFQGQPLSSDAVDAAPAPLQLPGDPLRWRDGGVLP